MAATSFRTKILIALEVLHLFLSLAVIAYALLTFIGQDGWGRFWFFALLAPLYFFLSFFLLVAAFLSYKNHGHRFQQIAKLAILCEGGIILLAAIILMFSNFPPAC